MTTGQSLDEAARVLAEAGFPADEARRDASVLARHALGWTMTEWAARLRDTAPEDLLPRLLELARRRATREPVAYITGVREFFGRDFLVTPDVLIPRPETEGLVEEALSGDAPSAVVDVGTGSGCLAVTLALAWPAARVVATDVSAAALAVARRNADRLGAGRVEFVETSLVPAGLAGIDLIVSNPPYIAAGDRLSLPEDVRGFEPATALFAGVDGLDVIRPLVRAAALVLRPGGRLILEIGAGQAAPVSDLVRHAGLELVRLRPDLQGIPRIVVARRPAAP